MKGETSMQNLNPYFDLVSGKIAIIWFLASEYPELIHYRGRSEYL